jgi:hypothetical protein
MAGKGNTGLSTKIEVENYNLKFNNKNNNNNSNSNAALNKSFGEKTQKFESLNYK